MKKKKIKKLYKQLKKDYKCSLQLQNNETEERKRLESELDKIVLKNKLIVNVKAQILIDCPILLSRLTHVIDAMEKTMK